MEKIFRGSVAIYFRETHTGWAFSIKERYKEIQTRGWETDTEPPKGKVPISVLIKPDGKTLDSFGYVAEGRAQLEEHKDWFYFKRVKTGVQSDELEDSAGKRLPAKLVFNLVFQYLKYDIIRALKSVNLKITDICWVLCFPVIWDAAARGFMMDVARDAGIPGQNIKIVSDSQAASVCCRYPAMKFIVEESEQSLKTLSCRNYFILNAEEGSVYLTVHEVINRKQVRELHSSRIDYGGNKINDAFENFLKELLGQDDQELPSYEMDRKPSGADVMSTFKRENAEDYNDLFRDFEKCKQDTRSIYDTTRIIISIPKSLLNLVNKTLKECVQKSIYQDSLQVDGDKLSLTFEVIESAFIITHIEMLKLVYGCSAIVMAGWFSEFTITCISRKFGELAVIISPEMAVLKGAVICGHKPKALVVGQDDQELPSYKMDSEPRGWCIILNVETVHGKSAREGTQYDKASLEKVFRDELHFRVKCHDNPTSSQMKEILVNVSLIDHSPFDCFVCCILSHGGHGHVLGSDNEEVPIIDLASKFNASNCPTLSGKPKLFFIQACQGNGQMPGVPPSDIQTDARPESSPVSHPLYADFVFGYPTVPGYVAYRIPRSGSWYIQALCEALRKYHTRYHLLEILTAVNSMVAQKSKEAEGGALKQIPEPRTTLLKRLYFR